MTDRKKTNRLSPVSADERLQLIGLLSLCQMHNRALRDCEQAMLNITQEWDSSEDAVYAVWRGGHTGDVVGDHLSEPTTAIDELLRTLGIAPAHEPTP